MAMLSVHTRLHGNNVGCIITCIWYVFKEFTAGFTVSFISNEKSSSNDLNRLSKKKEGKKIMKISRFF